MNETRKLAQFVADTKFEDLPTEVVEKSKVYLLDNLACGFVGSVQPWSKIVAELVQEAGGKEEASMFNQAWQADISRAS
ncbi:MmgE/PrpD family protein, partial [Chloroflexota bacterium]